MDAWSSMPAERTLSRQLQSATRALHRSVERTPVVQALMGQTLPRAVYARLLAALLPIYLVLEEALAAHAWRDRVDLPALARAHALRADLLRLGGGGPPSRAGERHARRIRAVADREPARLAGHAYVRYLGDLSGGQLMARAVQQAYPPGDAVAFYDFGGAAQVARLKAQLRGALDALPPGQHAAVVDEAVRSFALSAELFEELQPLLSTEAV